ncbi:hypothetical protein FRC04_005676 [Tulasnella sp. 424]|nr:hypothetical protein FRC04_005676 [Tulasnella sp. 424]
MSQTIDIPDALRQGLRKFRLTRREGIAAFIAKVNKQTLVIEEDTRLEDITVEELAEELPGSSPRFVLLAWIHEHDDGRKSYPLVLINWTPRGSETGIMTLHASAYILFQNLVHANKTIDISDGEEALTHDVIDDLFT